MKQEIWIFVLFWSVPLTNGDLTVTCIFTMDCLLPCNSTYHDIIRWHKEGRQNAVHAFINDQDDLEDQEDPFRGRTSLFREQIAQGNASLLLRKVQVEDNGIYTCYTSSNSEDMESIVRLLVEAPIKRVDIKLGDEEITCSTREVYPEPIIFWYENHVLQNIFTTEIQKDTRGLFSLTSVLTYKDKQSNKNRNRNYNKKNTIYACSISFTDKNQNYTAILRQEDVDIYSGQDANIHCPVSREDAGDSIISVSFGEYVTILKSQPTNITVEWAGTNVHLTQDGSVTIHKLDMKRHIGKYTCERFTAQSTTEVVQTSVNIISDIHNNGIAEAFAASIAVMAIICLIIYYFCKRHGSQHSPVKPNGVFLMKSTTSDEKKRKKGKLKDKGVNGAVKVLLEPLTDNNTHLHNGSVKSITSEDSDSINTKHHGQNPTVVISQRTDTL